MPGPAAACAAAAWSGLGPPCRRQHFSLISGTQSQDDGRMKWRAKREEEMRMLRMTLPRHVVIKSKRKANGGNSS